MSPWPGPATPWATRVGRGAPRRRRTAGHPEGLVGEIEEAREPRVAPGRPHEPRAGTAPKGALELLVPGVHVLRLYAAERIGVVALVDGSEDTPEHGGVGEYKYLKLIREEVRGIGLGQRHVQKRKERTKILGLGSD